MLDGKSKSGGGQIQTSTDDRSFKIVVVSFQVLEVNGDTIFLLDWVLQQISVTAVALDHVTKCLGDADVLSSDLATGASRALRVVAVK